MNGSEDEPHRHILQKQPNRQLHRHVVFDPTIPNLQLRRHHHFHAHFANHLWHLVRCGSYSQRTGDLRGEGMQEETCFGHLCIEPGYSRHAVLACDAFQHSPVGQRKAMGLWKLYVQSGCGGGRQQPVYHSGNCCRVVH